MGSVPRLYNQEQSLAELSTSQLSSVGEMQGEQVQDFVVQFWLDERHTLRTGYKNIVAQYPEANVVFNHVYDILGTIASLVRSTPRQITNGASWQDIVKSAHKDQESLCNALGGKRLYSALYGTYTVALSELNSLVQTSTSEAGATPVPSAVTEASKGPDEGFHEQRKRKRNSTREGDKHKKRSPPVESNKGSATPNPQRVEKKTATTTKKLLCATKNSGDGSHRV
jgi:hypothetical protein